MKTRAITLTALFALASVMSGCANSATAPTTTGASASNAQVSLALSWTPNTDYTGVYVAMQRGYYAKQGIDLTILPYASTAPETLVASGVANFGFSYQAGVTYARAAGQDVVSVFAPNQKGTYAIGVLASRSDITRPRDLDGKIYAGFGTPDELPLLRTIIRNDGGSGEFTSVTLNTSAYEALAAGTADFTIPVITWEGVQAEASGAPMKSFALTDYGFPDQYSVLIASSAAYLSANPDTARRFLAATQEGYAFAAANPVVAAEDMVAANPGAFPDPSLVVASQKKLVEGNYLTDDKGRVGYQSAERWSAYGDFLTSNSLLVGADGSPLSTPPDWSSHFTNEYLP